MKKIIFTVTNDLNFDQRMQRICGALVAKNYDVLLVGRQRKNSLPLADFPFQQTRLRCVFDRGKLFYIEYNLRLFFYLLFKNANAYCAIDLDTIVPNALVAALKRKKLVYDAHELFPEVPEVVDRPITKWIWQCVQDFFVPRAHLVYASTESIARVFIARYQITAHVIRNLPPLREQLNPNVPTASLLTMQNKQERERVILYQGALNEGRGLEVLIEVMKQLEVKLVIVGEGDLSQKLREQVARENLKDKISFTGMLRPDQLPLLTSQAYIGINLLENKGLSYFYSLANKFADYIHAALPQVCINFPEYKRINDQYHIALLVDELAPATIAAALQQLLEDVNLYEQLRENCFICRAELNWQHESEKLVQLYDELLR